MYSFIIICVKLTVNITLHKYVPVVWVRLGIVLGIGPIRNTYININYYTIIQYLIETFFLILYLIYKVNIISDVSNYFATLFTIDSIELNYKLTWSVDKLLLLLIL